MVEAKPQPSTINPRLILPFVNAVRQLFLTMVKVDVVIGKPHFKTTPSTTYDVSGIIGFSGDMVGSIAVSFSASAALKLVESFAGMRLEQDSPDFVDAVGELANMIAGSAKSGLGANAGITVPLVIIGKGYTFASLSGVPCIVVPCTTPFGDFAVEVCIKER